MTISASTLSKLLGHEPVEVAQIPGRVVNTMSIDDPVPESTGPTIAELVQDGHLVSPNVDAAELKRQKQREYQKRWYDKNRAKKLAGTAASKPAGKLPQPTIEKPKPVEQPTTHRVACVQPKEQLFEVSGHAAFRIAQTMYNENLLSCRMVIEGQSLQFIFTVIKK